MDQHPASEDLLEFPCDYLFKAFGPNDPEGFFAEAVRSAVATVVPVSVDAVKMSRSANGTYLCVTVLIRLHNYPQLTAIYGALRHVDGLKYLL